MINPSPHASNRLSHRLALKLLARFGVAVLFAGTIFVLWMHWINGYGQASPLRPDVAGLAMALMLTAILGACGVSIRLMRTRLLSEQQRINREQRLNADLKRALDEHALVSIADVAGRIIFANEKFCSVSGYSKEELIGQNHRIVKSERHELAYMRAMWRTIAQGEVWQGEFCNRRKGGEYYWVDTTIIPFLDEFGKPYQYVSVRRDITALKEAELRAQRLGERLQWLLGASPAVLYAHENPDTLTQYTFVSSNVGALVGHSVEHMLEQPDFWLQHLHPGDRTAAVAVMGKLMAQGEATAEYRFRAADGQYRRISDHARIVRAADGQVQGIVGSWTDITESKALERDRLRLRMAVEASADMIFLTNLDGLIEYANPAFYHFTGWDSDELQGQSASVLASGRTAASIYQAMWEALLQGKPWYGRLLNRRKKIDWPVGQRHFELVPESTLSRRRKNDPPGIQADPEDPLLYWAEISITPIIDEDGGKLGYVSFQRDISATVAEEERQALARMDTEARLAVVEILNQSAPLEERFDRVLDRLFALPDLDLQRKGGVFLREKAPDRLRLFLLRGEFGEEFTHYEQSIPFGACLCGRAAVSGECLISDDCFCDPRYEHRFEGMENHGYYIIPLVSGTEVLGVLFLYTDPNPAYSSERIEILKQIGEYMAFAIIREQARKMLEQARDAALDASRQKSEFLANMSHEIRTPMNGILGMLELLRRSALSPEQQEFADTAAHSAETLLGIINSILDFSRIEAGKLDLDYADFDLRELVEEVCTLLAAPAFAKGLELNCFVEPELPTWLRGDPMRLRQVMTNLVGNAIKFTEQGEVCVEVVCQSQDEQRAELKFAVRDTGIGILPEQAERLFRPFEQADGATTRRFGGTGLGLSISNSLVVRMGGHIEIESLPGKGAKFWFSIAFDKQQGGASVKRVKNLAHRQVLVVDDNATNRTILSRFLESWGARVQEAEDAFEALKRLREAHARGDAFDLAILDMNMPDMDGLMLGRAMQQEQGLAATPRILLSSGGPLNAEERSAAGICQSMTKPVRQSMLFDAVVSVLNGDWIKPAPPGAARQDDLPHLPGRRVLLVEDNPINQRVALKMLERFEVACHLVCNGREALAELERHDYDLVLMDCHMPEMDGYTATRTWRGRERAKGIGRVPVVALTANALEGDRERCLGSGMDDHLGKPFLLEDLAGILVRWLVQPALAAEAQTPKSALPWDPSAALQRLGGDAELLAEMRQMFVEEGVKQVSRLLAEPADWTEIGEAAHALKGMAIHFYAKSVIDLAMAVEKQAREGGGEPNGPQVLQLASAVEELIEALAKDPE
jgi:PAS domain S-box-containing protein